MWCDRFKPGACRKFSENFRNLRFQNCLAPEWSADSHRKLREKRREPLDRGSWNSPSDEREWSSIIGMMICCPRWGAWVI